jgi:hypothetical protein
MELGAHLPAAVPGGELARRRDPLLGGLARSRRARDAHRRQRLALGPDVRGAGPGQPTTWIYAQSLTVKGLLDGLRAGHTFVSDEPPNYLGPHIYLEADGDRNGTYESMMGDTVPPGSRLRVRVTGGAGTFIRGFTNGGRQMLGPVLVTSNNFSYAFRAPAASTWVRAELAQADAVNQRRALLCPRLSSYCRNRILVFAMTSAIYLS